MSRNIFGLVNGKCRYSEEMPNDQYMQCDYTAGFRIAIAQQHKDYLTLDEIITSVTFGSEEAQFTYTIDGKVVANPAEEALENGECVIVSQ